MKMLFLGTGAADWDSDTSPEIDGVRRMSSVIINDTLLVDAAPSTFRYFKYLGGNEADITNMLLTHSHLDHFYLDDVAGFAKDHTINVWCNEGVIEKFKDTEIKNVKFCPLKAFEKTEIDGVSVVALPANHDVEDSNETSYHYIIESDGKKLFYGCDGGWFLNKTWDYLRERVLDCIVLDCTCGEMEDEYNWRLGSHNDITMLKYLVKNMRMRGVLPENSVVIASHIAKTLHKSKEDTEQILAKENIVAAYDGMVISL